jgi:hypothetical protein
MKTVDVGRDFHHRLANRDTYQGDGRHTAVEFRAKYLSGLDNPETWKDTNPAIVLDFQNVKKIGPSFANEAFGHFMKYTTPQRFLEKVKFINISDVQRIIIKEELESGYKGA